MESKGKASAKTKPVTSRRNLFKIGVPRAHRIRGFAEAIAHWVREDVAPAVRALGAPLKGLDNYASYDCRGRNRVIGAKHVSG